MASSLVSNSVAAAATTALPHISRGLLIRGGAVAAVAVSSALTSTDAQAALTDDEASSTAAALSVSGGEMSTDDGILSLFGLTITPEARATLAMALAMATHYGSYSFARPTTLSLFTSAKTGFGGKTAAYPLAMGLVSPTSLMLLLGYGGLLERSGPRAALRRSSLYCAATLGVAASLIHYLQGLAEPITLGGIDVLPYLVAALFVFRESYVQLITSQHWSFMSSVLTPAQSSVWFAPISGLTSVMSAVAGMGVSSVVHNLGLTGTMGLAALMLALSTILTESAYSISEKYGFNPGAEHDRKIAAAKDKKASAGADDVHKQSLFRKATDLFARVPVLKALFIEILASQGVSTILNVAYVTKLSSVIPDDKERAGWSGKFFAIINVVSGFLQFAVLPQVMQLIEPSTLWRIVPAIVLTFASNMSFNNDPSLYLIAGTFLTMKALEFSARRMLDEMVYVPLDYDARYIGKEVIGVLGYRFGKSGTSLAVSALTSQFSFGISELSWLTCFASLVWASCTWRLSNLVPTKAEAEEAFAKIHGKNGGKKRR